MERVDQTVPASTGTATAMLQDGAMQPRVATGPDRDELIADGIVHAIGIVLALVGLGVLIGAPQTWQSTGAATAAITYGLILVLGLSVSMSYNLWPEGEAKEFLRRCDHSAIFLLIAATYTPFLQRSSDHTAAVMMLVAVWVLAISGIAFKFLAPGRFHRFSILLYLALGWSGLIVFGPISESVPGRALVLIALGGIVYSVGIIFHLWETLRFQMAIWHSFVVVAAAVHYSAVLTCLTAQ